MKIVAGILAAGLSISAVAQTDVEWPAEIQNEVNQLIGAVYTDFCIVTNERTEYCFDAYEAVRIRICNQRRFDRCIVPLAGGGESGFDTCVTVPQYTWKCTQPYDVNLIDLGW